MAIWLAVVGRCWSTIRTCGCMSGALVVGGVRLHGFPSICLPSHPLNEMSQCLCLVTTDGVLDAPRWCPGRTNIVKDVVLGTSRWCPWQTKMVSGEHQDDVRAHQRWCRGHTRMVSLAHQDGVRGTPRRCPGHQDGVLSTTLVPLWGNLGALRKLAVCSNIETPARNRVANVW